MDIPTTLNVTNTISSQSARPKRYREDQAEAKKPKKKSATSEGREFVRHLLDQCKIRKNSMQERVSQNIEHIVPRNSLGKSEKLLMNNNYVAKSL